MRTSAHSSATRALDPHRHHDAEVVVARERLEQAWVELATEGQAKRWTFQMDADRKGQVTFRDVKGIQGKTALEAREMTIEPNPAVRRRYSLTASRTLGILATGGNHAPDDRRTPASFVRRNRATRKMGAVLR